MRQPEGIMKTIHMRTKVESDTLVLPELADLIGKPVEVFIVELAPADRLEVFAEALHTPNSPEEHAAQQTKFRAWRNDPRFEHLWDMIDRWLDPPVLPATNGAATAHSSALS
jgi:hypothetical protein